MLCAAAVERTGGPLIHEGDTVRFRVEDIYLPIRDDLPKPLVAADELEGTVVDFSDSGVLPRIFAIIDVVARHSVIVPVDRLERQEDKTAPRPT